ncbi:MAG: hypothetical protein Q9223_002912 [Gallowayella weberi]
MSEYWKSTVSIKSMRLLRISLITIRQPNYWCKYCKTFVRDTKLEKTNHEATLKHQGNIKRFLRDLHRGHENEEREKQKAKNEVERLNGVVTGASAAARPGAQWSRPTVAPSTSGTRQATPAERKAQLAKLAEMGIAVPEDFRREMAMAGDWQTIAERQVFDRVKEEGLEDFKDFKADTTLNVGVRKRKFDGQEEEEDSGTTVVRKGWGSTIRHYPGSVSIGQDSLETLLNDGARSKQEKDASGSPEPLPQPQSSNEVGSRHPAVDKSPPKRLHIKEEEFDDSALAQLQTPEISSKTDVKQEGEGEQSAIVFKKRRAKGSGKP